MEKFLTKKKKLVFATNLFSLFPIPLQPNVVDLKYVKI